MKKIFMMSVVLVAFAAGIFAQSTDTEQTTATATIVGPLALTKVSDMDFGTIAASTTAGTVLLGTDNSRTPAGGVALVPPAAGVAASFTVAGEASRMARLRSRAQVHQWHAMTSHTAQAQLRRLMALVQLHSLSAPHCQ